MDKNLFIPSLEAAEVGAEKDLNDAELAGWYALRNPKKPSKAIPFRRDLPWYRYLIGTMPDVGLFCFLVLIGFLGDRHGCWVERAVFLLLFFPCLELPQAQMCIKYFPKEFILFFLFVSFSDLQMIIFQECYFVPAPSFQPSTQLSEATAKSSLSPLPLPLSLPHPPSPRSSS